MSNADEYLKLVPRKYQEEIFDQARHENVIAALETGSGKTLIAALLVKWVMAQPSLVGKKTIFLVPKVPLVDQQRSFLAEQTPLRVRGYTGSMGVESWDKGRWALEFAQSDCLVMTGIPHLLANECCFTSRRSTDFQRHTNARVLEHG